MSKGKNKKVIGLTKDELSGKIIRKFVGLRAKSHSYLTDYESWDKKAKSTKRCVIKRELKFENYKSCLEATQLENEINYPEKNEINVDSFFWYKRKHKEFMKSNKLILKTQQRFKSEKYNAFTEEINKIALISNDDKWIQSIDSIETNAYRKSKDLISKKEEIKCNHIKKRNKND